jgi:hypothetical protein
MKPTLVKSSKKKEKIGDLVSYLNGLNCISYSIKTDHSNEKIKYHRDGNETPLYSKVKPARVAQLVEHDLAKVGVAGSYPVSRSKRNN